MTPLIFWTFTEDIFLLSKTVFVLAVGAPLIAAYIYTRLAGGERAPQPVWMIAALVLFALAGVAFSRVPALSAGAALPFLVVCGIFVAVAGTAWTGGERRALLLLVCCAALATSAYGIIAHFGPDPVFGRIPRLAETADERKVIRGFLGHADFVGAYLAMALPLMAGFFLAERKAPARLFAFVSIVASFSALLLTMTRASWLAAVVAAAFLAVALSLRKGWKFFLKFSAAGLLAAVVFFFFFSAFGVSEGETLLTRLFTVSDVKYGANASRLTFWGTALTAWKGRPATGHGMGTFPFMYPKVQPEFLARHGERLGLGPARNVLHAHNDYLQAAAENGAIGLLLIGAVAAGVFLKGFLCVLRGKQGEAFLAAGCLAALVAALVDALFMFPFYLAATGVYIAFAGGLVLSLAAARPTGDEVEAGRRPMGPAAALLFAMLSVAVVGSIYYAAGRAVAADALMMRRADRPYVEQLERARRLNPLNGEISLRIGSELYYSGKFAEALEEFKRAEKFYDSPLLHVYEAEIYHRLGDEEAARRHADIAVGNGYPPQRISFMQ